MTSSKTLAYLSGYGRVSMTKAANVRHDASREGFLVTFIGRMGNESVDIVSWSAKFETAVFKVYARAVDRGIVPDVHSMPR